MSYYYKPIYGKISISWLQGATFRKSRAGPESRTFLPLPVFARRHAAQLAKNTRERTERPETGFGSDFDLAHLRGDEQAAGVTDADILQKMNEVDPRVQLETLGQMRWTHAVLYG